METKFLEYAKKHINVTSQETGVTASISGSTIYLTTVTGKCYELSDKEVKSQAEDYLNSEIQQLLHG